VRTRSVRKRASIIGPGSKHENIQSDQKENSSAEVMGKLHEGLRLCRLIFSTRLYFIKEQLGDVVGTIRIKGKAPSLMATSIVELGMESVLMGAGSDM